MANTADSEPLSSRWRRYGRTWVPILALTALAGLLRFLGLDAIPPGLYHDEAYNGLDALGVLRGQFPIYFAANQGREPMFLYLIATTVGALGRTPGAVRLAAALCGTLTVPITYAMTRAWFDRRTALLSAAIISIMVWHVQLSRVGFRAVTLPLGIACFLWSCAHAFRSRRRYAWVLAGMVYGIIFYTYVAARFTPVALLALAAYLVVSGQAEHLWPGALYLAIGASVTLLPLGAYALGHWETVMGRPAQVSVLSSAVNQGDLWGTLGRHVIRTLGMFFVRGDSIPRHNVPGRPVFMPLMGAAAVFGTVKAVAGARRRDVGSALVVIWVGTMLVPTLAAEDAPHFLRAVGVLPLLAVLPALGLNAIRRVFFRQNRRLWGATLLCMVLALSTGATVRDYFFHYGVSPEAAYAFEAAATELAGEINRFLGVGWDGQGMTASSQRVNPGRQVYLDVRLWQAWEGLWFLVPEQEALTKFEPNGTLPPAAADEILLLLWPYDDLQPYLAALPHPAQIEARVGPLTRGDLEEKAYPSYGSYLVRPLDEPHLEPMARFGEAIELIDLNVEARADTWHVRLLWSAHEKVEDDYTVFVYACDGECADEQLVAQDDARPGDGYYPTHWWHPGDLVVDVHTLELPPGRLTEPRIAVGLYAWPAVERLPVTKASGALEEDMLILPVAD